MRAVHGRMRSRRQLADAQDGAAGLHEAHLTRAAVLRVQVVGRRLIGSPDNCEALTGRDFINSDDGLAFGVMTCDNPAYRGPRHGYISPANSRYNTATLA